MTTARSGSACAPVRPDKWVRLRKASTQATNLFGHTARKDPSLDGFCAKVSNDEIASNPIIQRTTRKDIRVEHASRRKSVNADVTLRDEDDAGDGRRDGAVDAVFDDLRLADPLQAESVG